MVAGILSERLGSWKLMVTVGVCVGDFDSHCALGQSLFTHLLSIMACSIQEPDYIARSYSRVCSADWLRYILFAGFHLFGSFLC